jgi:hypothetical protein
MVVRLAVMLDVVVTTTMQEVALTDPTFFFEKISSVSVHGFLDHLLARGGNADPDAAGGIREGRKWGVRTTHAPITARTGRARGARTDRPRRQGRPPPDRRLEIGEAAMIDTNRGPISRAERPGVALAADPGDPADAAELEAILAALGYRCQGAALKPTA